MLFEVFWLLFGENGVMEGGVCGEWEEWKVWNVSEPTDGLDARSSGVRSTFASKSRRIGTALLSAKQNRKLGQRCSAQVLQHIFFPL